MRACEINELGSRGDALELRDRVNELESLRYLDLVYLEGLGTTKGIYERHITSWLLDIL